MKANRAGASNILESAHEIASRLVTTGFAVDQATTVLLLNSLITALGERHRIFLNAFHRSGEVLNYFGHRLRRLGFEIHSLDPYSIIPEPQARDVMISLSGTLRTEPVLVSLLHADLGGLYNFVITGQSEEETRKRFLGVLPVHIPGVTAEGRAAEEDFSALLPLGGLFELRAFLFLEAIAEMLGKALGDMSRGATLAPRQEGPDPAMMSCLGRARGMAERVPEVMEKLVAQFHDNLRKVVADEVDALLEELHRAAVGGRSIYVAGYGRTNEIGGMFAYRLANLRIPVGMTPSRLERPAERGDLLVALSGSGYTYEILQRMNGARRFGLRTAALTAVRDSSVAKGADTAVVVPSFIEPRKTDHFGERRVKPTAPAPPSLSTFTLNALLLLEAVIATLMTRLGRTEKDLSHPDPWQGFEPGPEAEPKARVQGR